MNQLRVANKQERLLFEQTIQTDLTKIPNINQNVYGVQKFTPLIPNNPHNNQYGSDYKKNYDNNLGYNKILPNEHYPNYNQPSNFIGLDNNNPFNRNSNQGGNINNNNKLGTGNQFSKLNIDEKGENIPGNQTTTNYGKLTFERSNQNNISYQQNNKPKSKRDVMWDLKRQKTIQGGNNTIIDNFNSKKIIDNENSLRFEVSSPEVRNNIIKSNPLDNHYNINNNIHSGAPRDIIERTPQINIKQNGFSNTNVNQRITPNNQNNFNNTYNSHYQYNNSLNDLKNSDLNRMNGGVQEKIKTPNNIIYTNNGLNNNPYGNYDTNTERRRTPFENNRDIRFMNQPITPQNQYSNNNQNFQNNNIRGYNPHDGYQISNQQYVNTPQNNNYNPILGGGVDVRFNQKQPHSNVNKLVNDNFNNSMKQNTINRPFNNLKFNNY